MKRPLVLLLLIVLGALALRLGVMTFVRHPGIGDPNHYYNLGGFLLEGRGFNIDYIWQYNHPPEQLDHPEDYWMPLTGLLAAASMWLFGHSVPGALVLFAIMGALVPVLAYAAARQLGCSPGSSLFSAAAAAALPELVLNSVRTDTTIPNTLLAGASILLLTHGLRRGGWLAFAGSGLCAGLAYLVRSDSSLLLPMLAVTLLAYAVWGRQWRGRRWVWAVLVPVVAVLVALPWSLRNIQLLGTPTTPRLGDMFFLTDFREHFVYDTELSLETLLASQTPAQLIGKRLFEMAASAKILYTTLDVFLPVAVAGGLLLVLAARDRDRLLILAPTLILLGGAFVFYTLLVPFKSQGGSFKKAYITLIPLLLPLAAYALERAISVPRLRVGAMALAVLFTGANAVELVRADARFAGTYLDTMQQVAAGTRAMPDTNGDGEIILMAQDPFMLRFVGVRSVMLPMEDRNTILAVAQRYGVDYLMMPPDRPALDPLYTGAESDPRFVATANIAGTNVVLYSFDVAAE